MEGETIFSGLATDIRIRAPHYLSDFTDAVHRKVVSSSLYLFVACLANAIAFGALSSVLTGGQIGIIEMLIATAIGGTLYALLSAQPITLLGGTGPIVIFTALLFHACEDAGLDFIGVYAWTGIWAGMSLITMSILNTSNLMRYFSRFTDEIFAALVSIIFVVEAVSNIGHDVKDASTSLGNGFFISTLAGGTFLIAMTLRMLRYHGQRPMPGTRVLADFAPTLAIVLMTVLALFVSSDAVRGPAVPESYTITSTGRPWFVDLWNVPTWVILVSFIPGAFAAILLFLDQNITSRIINEGEPLLRKGKGYHVDLMLIGLFTLSFSCFGLPWIVAATVHSVNHLKSLTIEGVNADGSGNAIVENRVSALVIHLGIAASLFLLPYVGAIPMPVLMGLFIYMGLLALWGNAFFIRSIAIVVPSLLAHGPQGDSMVPKGPRVKFTSAQGLCFVVLWIVKSSAIGILFPLFIALCVPVRLVMSKYFHDDHLGQLDDFNAERD